MKKVLPLILTCIMAFMVAGCGGPTVQPKPGPGGEEGRVETYEGLDDRDAKGKDAEGTEGFLSASAWGYGEESYHCHWTASGALQNHKKVWDRMIPVC